MSDFILTMDLVLLVIEVYAKAVTAVIFFGGKSLNSQMLKRYHLAMEQHRFPLTITCLHQVFHSLHEKQQAIQGAVPPPSVAFLNM